MILREKASFTLRGDDVVNEASSILWASEHVYQRSIWKRKLHIRAHFGIYTKNADILSQRIIGTYVT